MLEEDDKPGLIRDYTGFAEFAPDPLNEAEMKIYRAFLSAMRARASWSTSPPGSAAPAMWIASLN